MTEKPITLLGFSKRLDASDGTCLSKSLPRLDNIHLGTLSQASPMLMRSLSRKSMQEASVGPRFHSQHIEPFMHWGCSRIRLNEQAFPATVDVNMAKQVKHTFHPGSSLKHPQSRSGSRLNSALSAKRPKSSSSMSASQTIAPWNSSFRDPTTYFQGRDAEPDGPWSPRKSPRTPKYEHSVSTMTPPFSPMALTSSSFAPCSKVEPTKESPDVAWMKLFMTNYSNVTTEAKVVDEEAHLVPPTRQAANRAAQDAALAEAALKQFEEEEKVRKASKTKSLKPVARAVMLGVGLGSPEKSTGPNLEWAKLWHQGQNAKEGIRPKGQCSQGAP
eukprot:gnl/MRDRNA2_/MRDRNA2_104731_c0_seq1.p1 gnl/MRDRNA2_/MRDRNA2_104731_c0~~gnl/MRDRNA2_/MRDRNA2_104731_c0_seq1.p1  ORF type:complete len:330 (+),score=58.96 gnl/MRDRNA2_/MRDRNA2_104731_c0_seq1:53-1042(+)